jgi:predicted naringenin-chalcone synthase
MTWHVTDLGFRMGLSPRVPDVLSRHVAPLVTGMLERHGMGVEDISAWAVHPGGPRILDVVRDELGLTNEDLEPSRATLAEHGNCSSPTVLMILDRIRDRADGPVVAMAFGPGLTLYASLLLPS